MVKTDHEPQGKSLLEQNREKAVAHLGAYLQAVPEGRLRRHQMPFIDKLHKSFVSGETAGYIVLPTGGGKTVVAAELIQTLGLNTIVVSPTGEILDKTGKTIEKFAPGVEVTNFDGRFKSVAGKVINTTQPSLETLAEIPAIAEGVELVIVDELHHGTLGKERHKVWRKFPNALLLGLTATPDDSQLDELERRGLVDRSERWRRMFTNRIHEMSREEAQDQGALVPVDIHLVTTNSVVGNVQVKNGEYDEREIDRLLNTEARNLQIIALLAGIDTIPPTVRLSPEKRAELESLHEKIRGKRTAIFGLNINHVEGLAKRLRDMGLIAAAVHGKMPRERQSTILEAHANGELPIVLGVDILSLGWDSPPTEVGIFARPRRKDSAVIQEVGRLLRTSEETGKERAIAIQLVDAFEDMDDRPVLIPEVMDPDYILHGGKSLAGKKSKLTDTEEKESIITVSGIDMEIVDALIEQRQTRKRIEASSSLDELNNILDDVITIVRQEEPSVLEFYRTLAGSLPSRLSSDVQKMIVDGIQNTDFDPGRRSELRKMGQKAFILLNLKSIFSAIDPYFSQNETLNEEILQTALIQVLQRAETIDPDKVIGQIHGLLRSGDVTRVAAEESGIPLPWIKDKNSGEILKRIDNSLEEKREASVRHETSPEPLDGVEVDELSVQIAEETNYDKNRLREVVLYQNAKAFGENDQEDSDMTSEAAIRDSLERSVDTIFGELSEREATTIQMRYGFNPDYPEGATYDEVGRVFGLSRERIRQIESKALGKLKHPSRSKKLRAY